MPLDVFMPGGTSALSDQESYWQHCLTSNGSRFCRKSTDNGCCFTFSLHNYCLDLVVLRKFHCYDVSVLMRAVRPLERGNCNNTVIMNRGDWNMLNLRGIKKSYDGVKILNNISLDISDGEIVSVLGPSGSGKTTLLNVILGITALDSGEILFDGEDVSRLPAKQRDFNIVFQDYALFPNLNAYDNITYGLKNKPEISTQKEVDELIGLLGLGEHLDKKIDQLSGGQKQRVALARTLVMKPKVLLLDEPLSALDGVIKESIKDRIKTIARTYNLTTIIVTHDPEEALTLSDRVLIMNEGKISQYSTPREIINHPNNNFVKNFILNQLEIKRNNIYSLFGECYA